MKAAGKGALLDIDQNSDVTRDESITNKITPNIILNGSDSSKLYKSTNKENTNPVSDPQDDTLTNENCDKSNNTTKKDNERTKRGENDKSELFEILESITSKLKVILFFHPFRMIG